ncbi:TPA: heat-inducible protein, partial [Salmonella enterica subsp. enterica serovar Paratyphi B]|nr:heat-inducible protein [Salmonella enterica subsp. enterica serovar Paratyphi B]
MKKSVTLVALSIIMTGCVSSGKVSVKREQLEHHRFVLESVNGKTCTSGPVVFLRLRA